MPQAGDWDLMLRWQSKNYLVGHSLIPTTKCRKNVVGSVSSASYLQFRDLKERTRIILKYSRIFDLRLKLILTMQLVEQAMRRIAKLILIGKFTDASVGLWTSFRCVTALLWMAKF